MKLKEYFTEEPFDVPGVDIPCCIGDYVDINDNDPSSIAWEEDTVEGYHYIACRKVHCLKEGEPLCDLDAVDGFTEKISTHSMNRYDAAQEADRKLDEMLQMRRENDLRLGEVLTLFKKKKGEDNLGHRSIGTFAVEHLDFSGRLASELMHNHEIFSALHLTKEAFRQGEITKSALRHLSKVLNPENEAEWLIKAQNLSLRALERAVEEALREKDSAGEAAEKDNISLGSSCNDDDFTQCAPAIPSEESAGTDSFFSGKQSLSPYGVMMYFNVSNRLAPVWDFALLHFRNKEQYSGPVSRFVEALLADYITSGKGSGFGTPALLESGMLPAFYRCYLREDERDEELMPVNTSIADEANQHDSGDEAPQHCPEEDDGDEEMTGRRIIFPPSFHENPDTLEELAAKLIELGRNRQEINVGIGKILRAIDDWSLHRILNFRHIFEYGKERCDLPKPMLYRLINLVNGFRKHPLVEKAFRRKFISREQAQQILRVVTAENEMIWIDYAAHESVIRLKEEVERCARIIEYDCFAPVFYDILPGFRYITDDRYHELPEEMKDILRTGSWYQHSSPEHSWPIEDNSDEQMLMERDPSIDEPWKYFKDIDELEAYQAELARTAALTMAARENPLCAPSTGQGSKDSLCACGTGQGSAEVLCAPLEIATPASKSGVDLLCAPLEPASPAAKSSAPASPLETTCKDSACSGGTCSHGICSNGSRSNQSGVNHNGSNGCGSNGWDSVVNGAVHAEETLAKVREICTMPHGADPAETFLMDILRDSGDFTGAKTGMSIKFFLPEELYDLWNTTFAAYLQQSVAEGTMLRRVNDVEDIYRSPLDYADSAESFLAALLQGWLLTEKAHLRFARNYAILKRDRFRCQVPGCNCRRNLHIHHIIPRSQSGSDEPENKITLCEKHHLRLLHNLLTLKIEGTAPHNLTFIFGPPSHRDGRPFLKYIRGRKVLTGKTVKCCQGKKENMD
ncbi:MAG: HNH endonuclease [Candidatus Xenobiia bacterium LiM19]